MEEQTKLIQGDCLKEMQRLILEGVEVDYVFTSPPYNRKRNDKYKLYDDTIVDYFTFSTTAIDLCLKLSLKGVFWNIQTNYYNRADVYKIIGKYAENIQEIFIWEKSNPMPASGKSVTNAVEFFLYIGKDRPKSNSTYTKNIITTSVNSSMPAIHKAVMKQEVCDWFIDKFTTADSLILDPFMGLGTTGVSCNNLKRRFIGIELVEEYFNIAKEKICDPIMQRN